MEKTIAIIQVRMESSRLPNKALLILNDKPCLQHIIERTKRAKSINDVIVVTTTTQRNNAIANLCREINCLCVRYPSGADQDMMDTVLYVIHAFAKKDVFVVEITGDCPLIDPDHIDFSINLLKKNKQDYVSNCTVRSWPDGFDVQVYTGEILKKVNPLVTNPKHRKHVGWNIVNQHSFLPKAKLTGWTAPEKYWYPEWGLTLDTEEDYRLLNLIFTYFENNKFSAGQAIDYILENPELLKINKSVKRKIPGEG